MSNAVFQRHQQRVHILESFELGLIDLVDDATKTRIKRYRLDCERFTVSLTSERHYIAILKSKPREDTLLDPPGFVRSSRSTTKILTHRPALGGPVRR